MSLLLARLAAGGSPQSFSPASLASAQAFGVPTQFSMRVYMVALSASPSFGAPTMTPGPVSFSPASLTTAALFGTPAGGFHFNETVTLSGLGSAQAFGAPTFKQTVNISGLATAASFGIPAFKVTVNPSGLGSAQAFGATALAPGGVYVAPTGLGSAQALGIVTFNLTRPVSALDSAALFGVPDFTIVGGSTNFNPAVHGGRF